MEGTEPQGAEPKAKRSGVHPNSLANLKPYKPGETGNPHGSLTKRGPSLKTEMRKLMQRTLTMPDMFAGSTEMKPEDLPLCKLKGAEALGRVILAKAMAGDKWAMEKITQLVDDNEAAEILRGLAAQGASVNVNVNTQHPADVTPGSTLRDTDFEIMRRAMQDAQENQVTDAEVIEEMDAAGNVVEQPANESPASDPEPTT